MPAKFRPGALQHGMGWTRESKKAETPQRKSQSPNTVTSTILPALKLLVLWQLHVCFFADLYQGPKSVRRCRASRQAPVPQACLPPALPRAPAGMRPPCGEGLRPGRAGAAGPARGSPGTEGTRRGAAAPSAGPGGGKVRAASDSRPRSGPSGGIRARGAATAAPEPAGVPHGLSPPRSAHSGRSSTATPPRRRPPSGPRTWRRAGVAARRAPTAGSHGNGRGAAG